MKSKLYLLGKVLTKTEQQQIKGSNDACYNKCAVTWMQCLWRGTPQSFCFENRDACFRACDS